MTSDANDTKLPSNSHPHFPINKEDTSVISWDRQEGRGYRGVARNLLRGANWGSRDGRPPAGSRGRAPVGIWGLSSQKLETYTECVTVF